MERILRDVMVPMTIVRSQSLSTCSTISREDCRVRGVNYRSRTTRIGKKSVRSKIVSLTARGIFQTSRAFSKMIHVYLNMTREKEMCAPIVRKKKNNVSRVDFYSPDWNPNPSGPEILNDYFFRYGFGKLNISLTLIIVYYC